MAKRGTGEISKIIMLVTKREPKTAAFQYYSHF
jgi:hypothetical protein